MKLYSSDGTEIMEINAIEPAGDKLLIKGRVFGAMPLSAVLSRAEARKAGKLLNLKTLLFLVTLPFRR